MAKGKPQISWGDDLRRVAKMLDEAFKVGKDTKAQKVGGAIVKQLEKQKHKGAKGMARKLELQREIRKGEIVSAKRAADAKVMKSQEKTLRATRLGDAAEEKGSKLVRGQERGMSRKKVEEVSLQGRRAGAQRTRGNASKKSVQQGLQKTANDRSVPMAQRRAARAKLRAHQQKHGNFLN